MPATVTPQLRNKDVTSLTLGGERDMLLQQDSVEKKGCYFFNTECRKEMLLRQQLVEK